MDTPTTRSDERIPPYLRWLVDLRDRQLQKTRIGMSNRLSAIQRGTDSSNPNQVAVIQKYLDEFNRVEDMTEADIRDAVKDYPIYPEVSSVKGIGPLLAAKMIAMIDITQCDTVSALWRFAGLSVVRDYPYKDFVASPGLISTIATALNNALGIDSVPTVASILAQAPKKSVPDFAFAECDAIWKPFFQTVGNALSNSADLQDLSDPAFHVQMKRWLETAAHDYSEMVHEHPIAGEKLHYNKRLKTAMYLVGESFLKSNSPYVSIYQEWYDKYFRERPTWSTCASCETLTRDCRNPLVHKEKRGPGIGWKTQRVHQAAMRKMLSRFLLHLYLRWRTLAGLPIREPYSHEHQGHTGWTTPEEMGWVTNQEPKKRRGT